MHRRTLGGMTCKPAAASRAARRSRPAGARRRERGSRANTRQEGNGSCPERVATSSSNARRKSSSLEATFATPPMRWVLAVVGERLSSFSTRSRSAAEGHVKGMPCHAGYSPRQGRSERGARIEAVFCASELNARATAAFWTRTESPEGPGLVPALEDVALEHRAEHEAERVLVRALPGFLAAQQLRRCVGVGSSYRLGSEHRVRTEAFLAGAPLPPETPKSPTRTSHASDLRASMRMFPGLMSW